jgi:guanylate kinase
VHRAARYGTPRQPVTEALATGRPALLEIDLQGARQVRQNWPEARFVFLAPPSWEELVRRLVGRGTESDEERARRLRTAEVEMAAEAEFDVSIVNDDVRRATDELVSWMGLTPAESH